MKEKKLRYLCLCTALLSISSCKKEMQQLYQNQRKSSESIASVSSSLLTTSVRGDVNGDGKADLVTFHSNGNVYTYPAGNGGVFSSGISNFDGTMNSAIHDNTGHLGIDVTDVNGDGRSDVITSNTNGTIYVYTGKTDGSFNLAVGSFDGTYDPGYNGTTGYWPIAVGDVNGDGRGDLVSERDGSIIVHPGNADATFGLAVFSFNGSYNSAMQDGSGHYPVDMGDVNGDGLADLVTIHTDGTVYTYPGQSNYTFAGATSSFDGTMQLGLLDGGGHEPIGLGDVNGDGRADLVTHHSNGLAYVYFGQTDGGFAAGISSFSGGPMVSSIYKGVGHEVACVMDVTGDGRADLVTAHTDDNVYVYPGQSNGQFGSGIANFGSFYSGRFGTTPGHEIVMEKSVIRRRGTLLRPIFNNPFVTTADTPDPFIAQKDGYYYLTYSQDSRIDIRKAKHMSLMSLSAGANIWQNNTGTGLTKVWAPELHYLNGYWYVYFTATPDGSDFGHRMYYMRNTDTDNDPTTGSWTAPAIIANGPNYYAIDGTILTASGGGSGLWFIWCGRTGTNEPSRLYISAMSSPTTLTGPKVMISQPQHSWETQGYPVNEGPIALRETSGGLTYVVYSASAADQPSGYCLGLLALNGGGNPMQASDWVKKPTPVFSSAGSVYSPGHCGFFTSSYVNSSGTTLKQHWIVYHAKAAYNFGYAGRTARMQSFGWNSSTHEPVFGSPISLGTNIAVPKSENFN